jgi:hypothetical protein
MDRANLQIKVWLDAFYFECTLPTVTELLAFAKDKHRLAEMGGSFFPNIVWNHNPKALLCCLSRMAVEDWAGKELNTNYMLGLRASGSMRFAITMDVCEQEEMLDVVLLAERMLFKMAAAASSAAKNQTPNLLEPIGDACALPPTI